MWRVDPRNPRAASLAEALQGLVGDVLDGPEVQLVVGGDGWMLQCLHEAGPGGSADGGDAREDPHDAEGADEAALPEPAAAPVFLGLNAGTLGFLLNDVDDLAQVGAALRARAWTAYAFPRLGMTATDPDGQTVRATAVNDLYVERRSGQTARLRLRVDDELVVERLVCDGLIVSTALGSTAYSFSAGGVPCHPRVPALQVTPIAPHGPRLSPTVLPLDVAIDIEALQPERRPVRGIADGIEVGPIVRMTVERTQPDVVLGFLEGHRFTRALIRKVLQA